MKAFQKNKILFIDFWGGSSGAYNLEAKAKLDDFISSLRRYQLINIETVGDCVRVWYWER